MPPCYVYHSKTGSTMPLAVTLAANALFYGRLEFFSKSLHLPALNQPGACCKPQEFYVWWCSKTSLEYLHAA